MGATIGDCIMTFSGIVGTLRGDAAYRLVLRDLVEQIGQRRRIANVGPGDLDGPNLQRFLVDDEMDLAPGPPFGPPCLRASL